MLLQHARNGFRQSAYRVAPRSRLARYANELAHEQKIVGRLHFKFARTSAANLREPAMSEEAVRNWISGKRIMKNVEAIEKMLAILRLR